MAKYVIPRCSLVFDLTFVSQYLIPWARIGSASAAGSDPKLGAQMWDWMEKQVIANCQ